MEIKVGDSVYFKASNNVYLVEHISSQNEKFTTFKPKGCQFYLDLYTEGLGVVWTLISKESHKVDFDKIEDNKMKLMQQLLADMEAQEKKKGRSMDIGVGDKIEFVVPGGTNTYTIEKVITATNNVVVVKMYNFTSYITLHMEDMGVVWNFADSPLDRSVPDQAFGHTTTTTTHTTFVQDDANPPGTWDKTVQKADNKGKTYTLHTSGHADLSKDVKDERMYYLVYTEDCSPKIDTFYTKAELEVKLSNLEDSQDTWIDGAFHGVRVNTKKKFVLEDK